MDEPDFVAALAEDPADDGLWAVYADWLEERGDPRAEVVRLHLERAGVKEGSSRVAEIDDRLGVVADELFEECDAFAGHVTNGLMTSVGMTGAEFRDEADYVFRRHPVRGLTLSRIGAPGMSARIAESPWLGRLRMLGFVGNERARDVVNVLRSEHLGNVEQLVIRIKRIGKTVLSAACELESVRRLSLFGCNVEPEHLQQLNDEARFHRLDELDLRGNLRFRNPCPPPFRYPDARVLVGSNLGREPRPCPGDEFGRPGFGRWS